LVVCLQGCVAVGSDLAASYVEVGVLPCAGGGYCDVAACGDLGALAGGSGAGTAGILGVYYEFSSTLRNIYAG
jgi:hypothetical protein